MNRKHNDQMQYKYITNNDLLFKCVYFSFFLFISKQNVPRRKGKPPRFSFGREVVVCQIIFQIAASIPDSLTVDHRG